MDLRHGGRRWMTVTIFLATLTACGGRTGDDGATGTSVSGDAPTSGPSLISSRPATPMSAAGEREGLEFSWAVPEGWVEETPSSSMRRGQFRIPAGEGGGEDGECAVFYFGTGQGGGVQGNVRRWASQFEAPGGGAADPQVTEVRVGELIVTRVEVHGTYRASPMTMGGSSAPAARPDSMLLGAIVPGLDAYWFFKCTGPESIMSGQRSRFDALLASIEPGR